MNYTIQTLIAGALVFLSILLFGLALFSVFRFKREGVVLTKGILMSALFFAFGSISLFLSLIVLDRNYLISGLFLLCLASAFVVLYTSAHLFFTSSYRRRRKKGELEEVSKVLKSIFPDK